MPVEKTEAQKISPDGSTFHRSVAQVRRRIYRLFDQGVETHGISPTAEGARTDQRMHQMFTLWFSSCFNLSGLSGGALGPLLFKLDLSVSFVIILVVNVICSMLPAYLCMLGPKLGTRTMVLSRFSFGYYGAKLPAILNVFSMIGWVVLVSIVGGQFLTGSFPVINNAIGIVIITVTSLFVSFCGYRILHRFNSYIWIPNAVLFLTLLGAGGKNLTKVVPASSGMTASQIISFSSTIAALTLSWTANALDFSVHHQSKASGWKIFIYTFLGLFVSNFSWNVLGAVIGSVSPAVPSWNASLGANGNNFGALVVTILAPVGGFGKILIIISALSLSGANALNLYSFGLSLMCVSTTFAKVPRYLYSVIGTAIAIPIAIVGSSKFFATFEDIISLIGYWTASYTAILFCEHFHFRRNQCSNYQIDYWNTPRLLPLGAAAVSAFLLSFAIIVPCMDQAVYSGPIATAGSGDIGILVGFATSWILYAIFRSIERIYTPERLG